MIDGRTPVVVGVGAVQQRIDDPRDAVDAVALMIAAVERAGADCGRADVLQRAQLVAVPRGTWRVGDPARIVARHIGARGARTVRFELGVLQQSLLGRACSAIARDGLDVAVVCGGEAKYRDLRAAITGTKLDAPQESDRDAVPDEIVTPSDDILHPVEISRMLPVPARQYAVIDTALRVADGLTVEKHARELARLWASFSAVAQANPDAWNRAPVNEHTLLGNESNPMLASPYTKLHCSQWNVDQAGAVVVCSVDTARALGVPTDRWVFPHALVESNFMTPLVTRAAMHQNPSMRAVGERLTARSGVAPSGCAQLDLYSCFPAAVRLQLRELGVDAARQLTVTGGMTFGGGPLNNYTLQSLVKMCEILRGRPDDYGLVTAVSGMVTKFAGAVWSCRPPASPVAIDDVSDEARDATAILPVDADYEGLATIAGYTVVHERGTPVAAVTVVDTPEGARTVATSTDAGLAAAMTSDEWIGRKVTVASASFDFGM